jgi:hypothetical protein
MSVWACSIPLAPSIPKRTRRGRSRRTGRCSRQREAWQAAHAASGADAEAAREQADRTISFVWRMMHAFDVLGYPVRCRILEVLVAGEHAPGVVVQIVSGVWHHAIRWPRSIRGSNIFGAFWGPPLAARGTSRACGRAPKVG